MSHLTTDDERLARQALSLLELFALNHDETEHRIVGVCQRAVTPLGPVAAVCVYPRFVCLARTMLDRFQARDVRVVAVVNFPYGGVNAATVVSETRAAVTAGADEIDLVYPYRTLLAGDRQAGMDLLQACKSTCATGVTLTATLETGELRDPQLIRDACRDAILSGADFIKTSTGKSLTHATSQAARIMLECIAEVGGQVGFKAAGGVRTLADATLFMNLAHARFGPLWVKPERVRLGASSLLDDLLARLGVLEAPGFGAGY